ncbi:MAG: LytTR family transcriptional regulator [Candidatus Aminicenantes bacterium]|nr:LytTR family transcriptional regulator [Candidatus Aminicenantes bacterium]
MENRQSKSAPARIPVKAGQRFVFIKPEEIDCIEAERNYVKIQSGGESFLIRQTLAAIEKKLEDSRLVRVNRSAMVNIDRIKELRFDDTYNYEVVMDSGRTWSWGRKFRANMQRVLAP